jgi:hypothetical protein
VGARDVARQDFFSVLEVLACLPHAPPDGERIALDDLMHEVKEIRHTQALQALGSELNQGLCPVTDQGQHPRSQLRKSLLYHRFPRGIGAVVGHRFEEQLPR